LQFSVWRNPPTPWEILINGLPLWRLIPGRLRGSLLLGRHWDHATRREVPLLFGAAILARRKTIEAVGGFDEQFHMYCEDYEWCLRIRRAGWQLVFEPAASVIHHGGRSAADRWSSGDTLRAKLNAFFQFQRRSLSRTHGTANLLATCFVSFLHKSWFSVRGRPSEVAQITWELHLADLKRTLRGK
jgi:GT2 family glycosyltransferase